MMTHLRTMRPSKSGIIFNSSGTGMVVLLASTSSWPRSFCIGSTNESFARTGKRGWPALAGGRPLVEKSEGYTLAHQIAPTKTLEHIGSIGSDARIFASLLALACKPLAPRRAALHIKDKTRCQHRTLEIMHVIVTHAFVSFALCILHGL